MSPALAMPVVAAAVAALLLGLRAWQWAGERRAARTGALARPDPELVRKLVHVGIGCVALTFPWLFDRAWPVWVVSGLSLALVIGMRELSVLRPMGRVVSAVERPSAGDACFPFAVAVLFSLAHDEPALYLAPLLVLTVADAAAALIGGRYGSHRYLTEDGYRSLEGSAAFFAVGVVSVGAVLYLGAGVTFERAILIGALAGVLLTLAEAVSWRGLDNIVIPIAGYGLLATYLSEPMPALLLRLVVLVALAAGLWALRPRLTLVGDGLVATALALYLAWAIGGWIAVVIPVLVLCVYATMAIPAGSMQPRMHRAGSVLAVAWPALAWLIAGAHLGRTGAPPQFLELAQSGWWAAMAALAAALVALRLGRERPMDPAVPRTIQAWVSAIACVGLPGAAITMLRGAQQTWPPAAWAIPAALVSAFLMAVLPLPELGSRERRAPAPVWALRSAAIALASAIPLLGLLGGAA